MSLFRSARRGSFANDCCGSAWVYLFIGFLLFGKVAAAAEFGKIRVDSYLGKILDARVALSGEVTEDMWPLFRQASVEQYQEKGVEYTELHSRLLIDPVLSENPPYVAISSIGSVNRKDFTLLLENLSQGASEPKFKQYKIALSSEPKISRPPPKKRIISAPEVLWQLLTLLGTERGLSRAQVMAELEYLRKGGPSDAAKRHIIFRLKEEKLTQEFIDGLVQLMNSKERKAFSRAARKSRSIAVSRALFTLDGRKLLGRLLDEGIAESVMAVGKTADLRVQVHALQNKLIAMESQPEIDANQHKRAISMPRNVSVSDVGVWLFTRKAWILMTGALCLLFVLLVLPRLLRH